MTTPTLKRFARAINFLYKDIMKALFSGGCKNGKSTIAEDLAVELSTKGHLYYIATMIPHDEEDELRIKRHRKDREGKGFATIECGGNIAQLIEGIDCEGTYLIDSTTALLSNEMFVTEDGKNFTFDEDAAKRVADELVAFALKARNVVFVSDYIFNDIIYDELTEKYREGLALLDRELAKVCDKVCEVCLGHVYDYKEKL